MMIVTNKLLEIYKTMYRIRKFEEKAIELNSRGLIGGSIHLYIGEEAIAATVGRMLRKEDYISSTHRGHGHIIASRTYRWRGHWEGDPQVSRTKDELEIWMERCPIV